jgi:hypothetical protein
MTGAETADKDMFAGEFSNLLLTMIPFPSVAALEESAVGYFKIAHYPGISR